MILYVQLGTNNFRCKLFLNCLLQTFFGIRNLNLSIHHMVQMAKHTTRYSILKSLVSQELRRYVLTKMKLSCNADLNESLSLPAVDCPCSAWAKKNCYSFRGAICWQIFAGFIANSIERRRIVGLRGIWHYRVQCLIWCHSFHTMSKSEQRDFQLQYQMYHAWKLRVQQIPFRVKWHANDICWCLLSTSVTIFISMDLVFCLYILYVFIVLITNTPSISLNFSPWPPEVCESVRTKIP